MELMILKIWEIFLLLIFAISFVIPISLLLFVGAYEELQRIRTVGLAKTSWEWVTGFFVFLGGWALFLLLTVGGSWLAVGMLFDMLKLH